MKEALSSNFPVCPVQSVTGNHMQPELHCFRKAPLRQTRCWVQAGGEEMDIFISPEQQRAQLRTSPNDVKGTVLTLWPVLGTVATRLAWSRLSVEAALDSVFFAKLN